MILNLEQIETLEKQKSELLVVIEEYEELKVAYQDQNQRYSEIQSLFITFIVYIIQLLIEGIGISSHVLNNVISLLGGSQNFIFK